MEALGEMGEGLAWPAAGKEWGGEAGAASDTTPSDGAASDTTPSDTTDDGFTDGFSSPEDDELNALGLAMDSGAGVDIDGDLDWMDLPAASDGTGGTPPLSGDSFAAEQQPAQLGQRPGGAEEGRGVIPPSSPPGEMFAASFLREFCTTGGLISTEVFSLDASPARKWGLERELPVGWYLLDRTSAGSASALSPYDVNSVSVCRWKVTGRQISEFNPAMPIQTRYCNPKDGCSPQYAATRAAVYTWCTQSPNTGEITESEQRLIHVYVGRASRKKSTRRKASGVSGATAAAPAKAIRKSIAPVGTSHRRAFNIQGPQSALQAHSNSLHVILKEVMEQLRSQNMEEAAAVVDAVVQKRFSAFRNATTFSGSVMRPSAAGKGKKLIERTDVNMARMLVESLKEEERETVEPSLRRKLQALCTRADADLDTLDKTVHVLFMTRDARENLHINTELQAIYDRVASTSGHPAAVPVIFTVVPNASAYTLWTTLTRARERFSHIHFSGHGSDASGSTLLLAASPAHMPRDTGSGSDSDSGSDDDPTEETPQFQTDAPVNDRAFANAIAQYHNRLPANKAVCSVFLNACSTTEQGAALIQNGIPYACVNDSEVSDHVAVAFSSAFYEQIALDNAVPVAHERAVNWVMLNVNERAYKLGGINGLRLLGAGESASEGSGGSALAPAPAPQVPAVADTAAAQRTTKEVADLIRLDLGLSQTNTTKQVTDAAVAELGLPVQGSLRARLQAVADELDISTGWSDTAGPPAAASAGTQPEAPRWQGQGCACSAPGCSGGCSCSKSACSKWLKPWAHFGMDCPKACGQIDSMVEQHGADRVRQALEEMWTEMEKRRGQASASCCKEITKGECQVRFMGMLKDKLSSSLRPAGQGSCTKAALQRLPDCKQMRLIWGDCEPNDDDRAIMRRLFKEMDFDPIAASMAVRETSGRGLHAAVEWLLQHLDSLTALSAALEESRAAAADAEQAEQVAAAAPTPEPQAAESSEEQTTGGPLTQEDLVKIVQELTSFGFYRDVAQKAVDCLLDQPKFLAGPFSFSIHAALRVAVTIELTERTDGSAGSSAEELLSFLGAGAGTPGGGSSPRGGESP